LKILIFDNNNYLNAILNDAFPGYDCLILSGLEFENFINNNINIIREKRDLVIFINLHFHQKNKQHQFINSEINNNRYSGLGGIDLLIWLRLNKFYQHCILYSFETIHHILNRKPNKLMICSPGTTFRQLPFDPGMIDLNNLKPINNPELLKPFLNATLNPNESRHEQANWWGIKQLFYVNFNFKKGSFYKLEDSYPKEIQNYLKKQNNQILEYIYNIENEKLLNISLKEKVELNEGDIFYDNDKRLKIANRKIKLSYYYAINNLKKYLSEKVIPKIIIIDDFFDFGWSDILSEILYYGDESDDTTFKTKIIAKDIQLTDKPTLKIRKYILNKSESYEGTVLIAVKDDSKKENDLVSNYKYFFETYIVKEKFIPDILLLDLRLMHEKGPLPIDQISGTKIFKEIRKINIGLPIIITTASNKISSFRELVKLGADEYWIKEGIDEQKTAVETIDNYYLLLYNIFKLSSDVYKVRTSLSKLISELENNHIQYWWEEKDWNFKEKGLNRITKASKEVILYIIKDIFVQYKLLLSAYILGWFDLDSHQHFHVYAGIFVNIGKIIEEVHNLKKINRKINKTSSKKIIYNDTEPERSRNDEIGRDLYDLRNIASHFNKRSNEYKRLTFKKLKETLIKLTLYLRP
jgi:CheY-like chemotaxis protein